MVGEAIAMILALLLALYGCAQLIRRVCLWAFRCPGCAWCCRLAVPRDRTALAPLLRCLESQAVWEDWDGAPACCRRTLVLLPEETVGREDVALLFREAPSVIPVTATQLYAMLLQLAAEENNTDD
ncbi:MAG: hypothetical protein IJ518_00865 [Clostridia bacterium]|nr:hypothetical protein [Clostridia bacterium]